MATIERIPSHGFQERTERFSKEERQEKSQAAKIRHRRWQWLLLLSIPFCVAGCHTASKAKYRADRELQQENNSANFVSRADVSKSIEEPAIRRVAFHQPNVQESTDPGRATHESPALNRPPAPPDFETEQATEATDVVESLPGIERLPDSNNPDRIDQTPLALDEVIQSVQRNYPLLVNATLERRIASGKRLSAQGEFDLTAKAFSTAAPLGFYETYRNGASLNQPIFDGGYLYSGYKIGDGNFQPWFKERETDEGGEFSLGAGVPLLKDRDIDKRRAELFKANLARSSVEPMIQAQLLEFVRAASQAYWTWIAAGRMLLVQQELLENAKSRVKQIEARVNAGDLKRIVRINNDQLVAARETKLIEAGRKLQNAAIKLSLFYRTSTGEPIVPEASRVLRDFPSSSPPSIEQLESDIELAIRSSPMLTELDFHAEIARVELRNARNMLLPKLDVKVLAAQDVGAATSSKRDKSPFELEAGLYGEVPLQRRAARGKIAAASGKLSQIDVKRQFVAEKTTAAVQDAHSALYAATERIDRASENLRLARETLRLGRIEFEVGNISLIEMNIYEKSVADAQLLLIQAKADFFFSLADYRAAMSLDPQADL